ncbi:hypothetical protein Mgra_00007929 [Meloidogyne graminicola]|uniref:Uncharacterized protein n=1 Tax=Meloidogyne graminicola TaxID=189291 RepID=A0A8S9ZHJ1_9BILA|nr:hypothetical protein Mgra_00007929 [Meloidogyne graminicola]
MSKFFVVLVMFTVIFVLSCEGGKRGRKPKGSTSNINKGWKTKQKEKATPSSSFENPIKEISEREEKALKKKEKAEKKKAIEREEDDYEPSGESFE